MKATELKSGVASYRLKLRNKLSKLVTCGPNGPIDIDLIEVLVEAISSLERRVEAIVRSDDAFKAVNLSSFQPLATSRFLPWPPHSLYCFAVIARGAVKRC